MKTYLSQIKKHKLSAVYSACMFTIMTASKLSTKHKNLHRRKNYFDERLVLFMLCIHYWNHTLSLDIILSIFHVII